MPEEVLYDGVRVAVHAQDGIPVMTRPLSPQGS